MDQPQTSSKDSHLGHVPINASRRFEEVRERFLPENFACARVMAMVCCVPGMLAGCLRMEGERPWLFAENLLDVRLLLW